MEFLVHPTYDVKVAFDPEIVSAAIASSISDGRYEHREANILQKVICDGDRVLELGGGIGFISTLIAATKKVASYTLVEADARLHPLILATHRENGVATPIDIRACLVTSNVRAINDGYQKFHLAKDFWASGVLDSHNTIGSADVSVWPLAAALEETKANALIVDIEGGEVELLDGALLPGVDKVIMETHTHRTGRNGVDSLFASMLRNDLIHEPDWSSGPVFGFRRLPPAKGERPGKTKTNLQSVLRRLGLFP